MIYKIHIFHLRFIYNLNSERFIVSKRKQTKPLIITYMHASHATDKNINFYVLLLFLSA